jgi:ADP-heptose:LPS heptosyltransferase
LGWVALGAPDLKNGKMSDLLKCPTSRYNAIMGNTIRHSGLTDLESVQVDKELVNIINKARKCAIFTMGGIGDHLFALPFIWSFRQRYPRMRIINITPQPLVSSFLLKANILDEIRVTYPPRGTMAKEGSFLKLWKEFILSTINLRKEKFDISIYLATGLTAKLLLWQWIIGAKFKIGIDKRNCRNKLKYFMNYFCVGIENRHLIENNLKLGRRIGCNIKNALNCFNKLFDIYISTYRSKSVLFIHPFLDTAEHDGRTWPLENFREVYQSLDRKGLEPVVLGTPQELEQEELNRWKNLRVLPLTSLEDSIRLLSEANLVIGNDSAVVHLASLLGVKALAVMCSSDPILTYPYFNGGVARVELDCSPCLHRKGYKKCKKFICKEKLTPEQVIGHPMVQSLSSGMRT